MKSPISIENLQASILEIRGNKVLLDSDVAKIYGLGTKSTESARYRSRNFDFNQSWVVFRLFDFHFFSLDNLSPA